MRIVNSYTGNPMINNALMTIKALAGLSNVQDITTELLESMIRKVCDKLPYSLKDLNLRFKSYTMLFSGNGLLYNPKSKDVDKDVYELLLLKITQGFELNGDNQCNLTGWRYSKTFSEYLLESMLDLGISKKNIKKKDLTLNRCWIPLLGGLGSDAQSLPMAKQTYEIHPICVVLLQFLPLSSFTYKKDILLIDSTALEFSEDFVEENVNIIVDKAKELISTCAMIEKMKVACKEHFILQGLKIFDKLRVDCDNAEVNLWSFSNSGNDAKCSIKRIPNDLLKSLSKLRNLHRGETENILSNPTISSAFIECLSDNKEWYGLYPSKNYDGVSTDFFESYWKVIGKDKQTEMAKYIAGLVAKYKDKKDDKILLKLDAYDVKKYDYASLINRVLWRATVEGEWTMMHQLAILDNPEMIPISYKSYSIYKMVHFYYIKQVTSNVLPSLEIVRSNAYLLCLKLINLINEASDYRRNKVINRILEFRYGEENNDVDSSVFDELFIEDSRNEDINSIYPLIYTISGKKNIYGLCALLRLYYKAPTPVKLSQDESHVPEVEMDKDNKKWLENINKFISQYIDYRMLNVSEASKIPELLNKINRSVPRNNVHEQLNWFYIILQRMNESGIVWNEYDLIYNPFGNFAIKTFIFAFRMKLNEIISNY